jgi:cytochrome c peroxidase
MAVTGWGIASGLVALGFISLMVSGERGFAESPQVVTTISANQASFRPGQTLTMTANVTSAGLPSAVDFYFGAVLPDGETVLEFTDPQLGRQIGSLLDMASLRPFVAAVSLTGPFSVSDARLVSYTWSGGEPVGRYVLFLAVARSGEPLPGSLIALSTTAVTFESDDAFLDPTGVVRTVSTSGFIDSTNPFFQSLGSNGRACVTCHQPREGWTVSTAHVQERFDATQGLDPIFRPVDGSNCPDADVSTLEARAIAYSLLRTKGLIRIPLPVPANAEFTVLSADNPYGCADLAILSMYRRPLPSTNLRFVSALMWDGRESTVGHPVGQDLVTQALNAVVNHAEPSVPPTNDQLAAIVGFEAGLFTAQDVDTAAGQLDTPGGRGGPGVLSTQEFFVGINDPGGLNPTGRPFTPNVFDIFRDWASLTGSGARLAARASVARGESIFNFRLFAITEVGGLNDEVGQSIVFGSCSLCHDTPNAGSHSVPRFLNVGLSAPRAGLPLYTLQCTATGEMVQTSDPGRAMTTGKCKDIAKVKVPILRGLAARAPYFHNGSAATLGEVVEFYDGRFKIQLTSEEKDDLLAFLRSL